MEKEEVAEGVWCHDCEFFEVEDFDPEAEVCLACGCNPSRHSKAVVLVNA